MQIAQQILFILISGIAIWLFAKKVKEIRAISILVAMRISAIINRSGGEMCCCWPLAKRKCFANPLVAVLHFFVYAGFIIINIEVLEIVLDGIFGTHRLFVKPLGNLYDFLINSFEILAVLVIIGCVVFLIRRNYH